ncbi:MAG: isoprenylcysteine carboxylmethyltransferase family protein [Pseudomonadales bacterium]
MAALLLAIYSACAYVLFLVTFLYAIGFVQGLVVPKSIDSGEPGALGWSVLVNLALLTVFAVQHSVMARPGFKRVWTRIVPPAAERSTYVLLASLALALLFWQWQPLPQPVWSIDHAGVAGLITAVSWLGWAMVLVSTFLISHFHLFGLSQGFARLLRLPAKDAPFVTPSLYRYLRHPIYAGFIVAFWAAPQMSLGHLLFAAASTGYIFVGIYFEERDLVAHFGDRYRQYRASVGMLLPRLRRSGGRRPA